MTNLLSSNNISSNQLFSNFYSKNVIFTKFLQKMCESFQVNLLRSTNFTENLSDLKKVNFPHCQLNQGFSGINGQYG